MNWLLSHRHRRASAPVGTAVALVVALLWLTGCSILSPSATPTAPGDFQAGAVAAETPVARTGSSSGGSQPNSGATSARATATPTSASPPAGLNIPTPLPNDRFPTIKFDRLPSEARDVIRLIARGGPFPYRQDGAVFQNRERNLPGKPSGYYHEYTVETPGSPDRGARRIIAGKQGELYYTDDHYVSFRRVVP
ncbi:MAG: guanine-specific ribonuclease N1 and T1 [Chloroflexi bacterium]|nr:guanine-specific ribonuclease N1 and T1 [Chloroflexota bacterium]